MRLLLRAVDMSGQAPAARGNARRLDCQGLTLRVLAVVCAVTTRQHVVHRAAARHDARMDLHLGFHVAVLPFRNMGKMIPLRLRGKGSPLPTKGAPVRQCARASNGCLPGYGQSALRRFKD